MKNVTKLFFSSFIICLISITSYAADRMKDKVVLITGGSKGIGLGITKVFATEGAKVVILSRTEKDLKKVVGDLSADGREISYIVGDISKPEDMDRMVSETM